MQDELGTRKMKLISHPNLFCNLVCIILFIICIYYIGLFFFIESVMQEKIENISVKNTKNLSFFLNFCDTYLKS